MYLLMIPSLQKGNFEAKENSSIITRFEEMVEKVKEGNVQIADARILKHFNGEDPEPTPGEFWILGVTYKCSLNHKKMQSPVHRQICF